MKKEKLEEAKKSVMTNYITSVKIFIDKKDKILGVVRLGIFGSILGYIWSVYVSNMFLNVLSVCLTVITMVVYYEFRDMTDETKSTRKILDATLDKNYKRQFKDVSEMKMVEDDEL